MLYTNKSREIILQDPTKKSCAKMNNTSAIKNKTSLVARLVLQYLEELGIVNKASECKWNDTSTINTSVVTPVQHEVAKRVFKKDVENLEIISLEMNNAEKCMVNVCSNDESLTQGIFPYLSLFRNDSAPTFPITDDEINKLYTDEVREVFRSKFKLPSGSTSRLQETPTENKGYFKERVESLRNREQQPLRSPQVPIRTPNPSNAHIPGFEDEYEVQGAAGIPVSGEFGVPGLGMPLGGYGDNDLYPNGMKFPQDFDPSQRHPNSRPQPGQGGMIFDPFRGPGPSPNPLSNYPPGVNPDANPSSRIPGVKYDVPYGRINRQGGGGGFI